MLYLDTHLLHLLRLHLLASSFLFNIHGRDASPKVLSLCRSSLNPGPCLAPVPVSVDLRRATSQLLFNEVPDLLGSLFVALTLDLACSFELGESALRAIVIVMHLQHQLLPLGPQHKVARLWCIRPRLE